MAIIINKEQTQRDMMIQDRQNLSRWVNHELTYIANKHTLLRQSLIRRKSFSYPEKTESSFCSLNFSTLSKELSVFLELRNQCLVPLVYPAPRHLWWRKGVDFLEYRICCGLRGDSYDQQCWLGLLSVRDHKATEIQYKALPEIWGEKDSRLLILRTCPESWRGRA